MGRGRTSSFSGVDTIQTSITIPKETQDLLLLYANNNKLGDGTLGPSIHHLVNTFAGRSNNILGLVTYLINTVGDKDFEISRKEGNITIKLP